MRSANAYDGTEQPIPANASDSAERSRGGDCALFREVASVSALLSESVLALPSACTRCLKDLDAPNETLLLEPMQHTHTRRWHVCSNA
eukprot:6193634-Pleurochrysis_carterae.AAC.7